MTITDSWVAGREAVDAFRAFSLAQRWVFVEVPGQSDFGKDGYVDITTTEGELTGACFAVQIKGGRSRWQKSGLVIDADEAHRRQWMNSTLPVIGIAHDPDEGTLHWLDISECLATRGLDARLLVPTANRLSGDPLADFVRHVERATRRTPSILDLASGDAFAQLAAVWDCFALGRRDPRALVLLRRTIVHLASQPQHLAIQVLGHATLHPDIFWTEDNWIPEPIKAEVRRSFQWENREVEAFLTAIDPENGLARGSIGQTVYHLLVEDPAHRAKVEAVAVEAAARGELELAGWSLALAVAWAGDDGRDSYEALVRRQPALTMTPLSDHIAAAVAEHGWLALW